MSSTEQNRRWRARNPTEGRNYARRSYLLNPEKHRQWRRDWKARNKEKLREVNRRTWAAHPEWNERRNAKRRAKKSGPVPNLHWQKEKHFEQISGSATKLRRLPIHHRDQLLARLQEHHA